MSEKSCTARKLIVEVCNARNLMPKDGQGTASAFAVVDFDGQRRRTTTKIRDLNPEWGEKLEFLIHDVDSVSGESIEINLFNENKKDKLVKKTMQFLGKVKISPTSDGFVTSGSESLVYYSLERKNMFSPVRGEIGVKVYYLPEAVADEPANTKGGEKTEDEKTVAEEDKKEEKESVVPQPEPQQQEKEEVNKGQDVKSGPPPALDYAKSSHPAVESKEVIHIPDDVVDSGRMSELAMNGSQFRSLVADCSRGGHDLVDMMPFAFVRVVKAKRSKPGSSVTTPMFVKVEIGSHSISTTRREIGQEWDQVFAFDMENLSDSSLKISLWAEEESKQECLGTVSFDVQELPKRVSTDSALAPQWYGLEPDDHGNDIMLSVWNGTQADEAFQEAWQSDSGGLLPETRSKVYLSPKLWYLRITVIQAQDLASSGNTLLYVKGQLSSQLFKTGRSPTATWNEDLVFVAAEPFEPFVVMTVMDGSTGKAFGSAKIHVASIERRTDHPVPPKSRWLNLVVEQDEGKQSYAGRLHVRASLEGGYHVIDEPAHLISDVQPSSTTLNRPPIGLLEVGIRAACDLPAVKKIYDGTRGTVDAYVVAKYGSKWVRTRTILDRFNPRWNEQYTWDVYDPCTVLTIGVFDNGRHNKSETGKAGRDNQLGRIRIRISTLDVNRVHLSSYPLTMISPGGLKKMGQIEIAVKFSCSSWFTLIQAYGQPMFPKMHHIRPLGPARQDVLRHAATKIVAARLARSEPPMGQEVVHLLLDNSSHMWSMRKSKANWFRVASCLARIGAVAGWLDSARSWRQPFTTVLAHVLLVALVMCPHLSLALTFLYVVQMMGTRYRCRIRGPGGAACRSWLFFKDSVGPDELDEELDSFPTTRSADVVRMRYDRLRMLGSNVQALLGDMATQGERLEALFTWRDPRASGLFLVFCIIASVVIYTVPFNVLGLCGGLYFLRHPRFRGDQPSMPVNFFRRLPSLNDLSN